MAHLQPIACTQQDGSVLTRDADDVWDELTERCRRLHDTNTPIQTLHRDVPNWITAVEPAKIFRRSASPRSVEDQSPVTRADIVALWQQLQADGHTTGTGQLRFAFALIGRLVE